MDNSRKNTRFERKYLISFYSESDVELMIKLHPALFSEVFQSRSINNIYFDSFDSKNYYENIEGVTNRTKVRIRWYGELFEQIESPKLEFKIKRGLVGYKKTYQLAPFNIKENLVIEEVFRAINKSNLPPLVLLDLKSLEPTLINRYHRKYFLSKDGKIRLTLDSQMSFLNIKQLRNQFVPSFIDYNNVVIELKYDDQSEYDQVAREISNLFPFRMTKYSKYAAGIESL